MSEQQDQQLADTVPIKTVEQLAELLNNWHQRQVATIKHFQDLPPGTRVQLNDSEEMSLEGDLHKGFQIGITTALNYLGVLPLAVEMEDQDEPKH